MWARFKRIIRAILGWFIDLGENPEMILKQNIKDMSDQLPAMNENLAMIKAQVTLTDKQLAGVTAKVDDLTSKIKAALRNNRRDIALNYSTTLEEVKKEKTQLERQKQIADASFAKAQNAKKIFVSKMDERMRAAQSALRGKQQAEWQTKVANAMETFQTADLVGTNDEMIAKLDQEAAQAQAKMELALDGMGDVAFEEEVASMEANETLRQFEIEMGLAPEISAPPEAPAEKTVGDLSQVTA